MQSSTGIHSTARSPRKAAEGKPGTVRARKKVPPQVGEPEVVVVALHPTPDELNQMIETTAYYFAAERNFAAGHELDDWLKAEKLIQSQLSR